MKRKIIKVDAQARISLGKFAGDIELFSITKNKNGRIILEPYVEMPLAKAESMKKIKQ